MQSISDFKNYRHDVAGKLKDISTVIATMDESSLKNPEFHDAFHAIHEVISKMLMTSKSVIEDNLDQEMTLFVVDSLDERLLILNLGPIRLGFESTQNEVKYFLNLKDVAPQDQLAVLVKVCLFLPVKKVTNQTDIQLPSLPGIL